VNWVQTAHFSFAGLGGFLKRVCVCVALEEVVVALTHSYDTLRFPNTESFGSPMQHTLRLLDS